MLEPTTFGGIDNHYYQEYGKALQQNITYKVMAMWQKRGH
jgi:hypothetical protein